MKKKTPKLPPDEKPWMHVGMGEEAAYHSGYVYGWQGLDSPFVCALNFRTAERASWMRGYRDGLADAGLSYDGPWPVERAY